MPAVTESVRGKQMGRQTDGWVVGWVGGWMCGQRPKQELMFCQVLCSPLRPGKVLVLTAAVAPGHTGRALLVKTPQILFLHGILAHPTFCAPKDTPP